MAQVTRDMAERIIEQADRYEWYGVTLGELRQLAYGWLQWQKTLSPATPVERVEQEGPTYDSKEAQK